MMCRQSTTSVGLLSALFLLLFVSGLAFGVQDTASQYAQQPRGATSMTYGSLDTTSRESPKKSQAPKSGIATNFSELTKQGGWVMYPIYAVFIIGLGVIVYQLVRIGFDKYRAKSINPIIAKKLSEQRDEADPQTRVQEIWEVVKQYPQSQLAKLLDKLCDLWHRDPSADVLQVEIGGFMDGIKERYEILRSFTVLLSDTAGALGLLGTVWGMYTTFMPGKLESTQVISGMGVALVTTISGLVVSIILNFAISYVHSTFFSHIAVVEEQADKFRNRFGKGQSIGAPAVVVTAPAQVPVQAVAPPVSEVKPPVLRRIPTTLKILSGKHQAAEAGASLPKPFEVAVEDQYGKPMENFPVIFEADGSLITFDNGENIKQVDTDFLGRAKAHARLGKMVGLHRVIARIDGEAKLIQEFEVESRPGAPDKVYILSENHQIGRPGELLREPLSLKLEDAHGNPVPDQIIVFEVTHNDGRLDGDKTKAEVHTDEHGVATIDFRLADTSGANIVKAYVKSKTTHRLETVFFDAMGKE